MRVLSRLFRRLFLEYLEQAFDKGKLQFFSSLVSLRDRQRFQKTLTAAKKPEWVVFAKPPFAGPEQVLQYLGRYTHRVAISNNRLASMENGQVQFQWKDYRNGNRQGVLTLDADEFVRRFLLHVLPGTFQRIRHYGFLANRNRAPKLVLCRQLLAVLMAILTVPVPDYRDRFEQLTGRSLRICPDCAQGQMIRIGFIAPPRFSGAAAIDSS